MVVDPLVLHIDAATAVWRFGRGFPGCEVVPRVVADIVCAAGLVNVQEVDRAPFMGYFDAVTCCVGIFGPVRHAVGVDLAADDADAGGPFVVRGYGFSATAAFAWRRGRSVAVGGLGAGGYSRLGCWGRNIACRWRWRRSAS